MFAKFVARKQADAFAFLDTGLLFDLLKVV